MFPVYEFCPCHSFSFAAIIQQHGYFSQSKVLDRFVSCVSPITLKSILKGFNKTSTFGQVSKFVHRILLGFLVLLLPCWIWVPLWAGVAQVSHGYVSQQKWPTIHRQISVSLLEENPNLCTSREKGYSVPVQWEHRRMSSLSLWSPEDSMLSLIFAHFKNNLFRHDVTGRYSFDQWAMKFLRFSSAQK